ncbi:MAG: TIGR03032 family protein [Elainella sp. C42_A2020_010]|nr:TIGR03032 family protein [Elainella sp. C42_A2020_010]
MTKQPRGSSRSEPSVAQQLQQIAQLGQSGNLTKAATQCQKFLQRYPDQAEAWHLLSLICLQRGQVESALSHIQRAIDLDPDGAEFHSQAGVVQCSLGNLAAGIACYQRALSLKPSSHTRFNLGLAFQKLGQLEAAEQTYRTLVADQPSYSAAYQQLGNIQQQQQQFLSAIHYYQQALQHQPQVAATWCNLAVAFQAIGDISQAQTAFQRALQLNPDYVEALNGLGAIYEKQELATQAIQHYQQALALQPDYIPALTNLGNIQLRLEQFPEAAATYRQILQLQPNHLQVLDQSLKLMLATGDWTNLADSFARLQQGFQTRSRADLTAPLSPLNSLFLPFSASEQQAIAQDYAAAIERRMAGLQQQLAAAGRDTNQSDQRRISQTSRIRLGYVSGDLRYHAVGQLILRLFELHDRQQFEVFAYSLGPDDQSRERQTLMQSCNCFRDVQGQSPVEIARLVMQDQIDILIDLAGYTNYACPELFALRPAPLQVNYLGYPGTLGSRYMDYIITDAVITPPELATTLTEARLYLPHTYQINCYPYPDSDPTIFSNLPKQQHGLPTDAFVFCCFNKSQKIEPTIFAVWMRILQQVPQSVLWLLSDRPATEQNLRTQAAAHGIDPTRLIFAPRVTKAAHLQRHVHADLFLDTLYYNAHVTASDALWAGTPLITVLGNTFAARVAASLLTAAGLPELITANLSEYEQLALHLATHPTELELLKQHLLQDRPASPLFDTAQTVQHLEAGYQMIWQRYQAGLPAESLSVLLEAEVRSQKSEVRSQEPEVRSQKSVFKTYSPTSLVRRGSRAATSLNLSSETITCTADTGFLSWLSQANGSLLITTYQAGRVLLVGWNGQQVTLLARQFTKPMGVAVAGNRLALSTQHELMMFANARPLAYSYLEDQPGRYDALYLPRTSYFTGDLHTHDLAFDTDGLWLVNTRFSCLASLSLDFSFVPRWYPPFISEIVPEDRCHLNGLAMVAGRPKYVTALGESDKVGGWRATKATGGIVIDVETDEIVLRGLSMPHSPRWYQERLWLLNSGTGELWRVDPATWEPEVVCALPGFGRGLALVGDYALVGLSQMREHHIFGELPLQTRFEHLICGVAVVDLQKGAPIGWLEFPTGCRELYDLKFLPGILRPNLLNSQNDAIRAAFTAPELAYWLRPSALIAEQ